MPSSDEHNVERTSQRVRDLINSFKGSSGISWNDWHGYVLEITNLETFTEFKHFPDSGKWTKLISSEAIGKRRNIGWWQDLELISKKIIQNFSEKSYLPEKSKNNNGPFKPHPNDKEQVHYIVFPCQDTMLASFFEDSYVSNSIDVQFHHCVNWAEGLPQLFDRDTNVVIVHNFSTAIAYNSLKPKAPLLFWPFFHFKGYGLFIKKESVKSFCAKNGIPVTSFMELEENERIKFLESISILVEQKTDFEWALKTFVEKVGGIFSNVHIINWNTNSAKAEFIKGQKYAAYCTNPIHIVDILASANKDDFELIPLQNKLNHKNFNGLICSAEYYSQHPEVIDELIDKWFAHTGSFLKKLRKINNPSFSEDKSAISFTISNLQSFLKEHTKSDISEDQVGKVYDEDNNHFYSDLLSAFKEFYGKALNNSAFVQNYIEIAKIQLGSNQKSEEEVKNVLFSIKQRMDEIYNNR